MPVVTFTRRAPKPTGTSWNAEDRTFEAIVSRFADVARDGYVERLSTDPRDWDLTAVDTPAGMPFLDNHRAFADGSAKLGRVLTMRMTDSALLATVRLGRSPAADRIAADLEDGIGVAISFSYTVGRWDRQAPTGEGPEVRVARAIRVFEVSAVNLPADSGAHIRSSPNQKENRMPRDAHDTETITDQETLTRSDPSNVPNGAVAAERRRVAEIFGLASRHAMPEGFAAQHVERGSSLDDVRTAVFAQLESRQAETRISPRTGDHNSATRDNPDAFARAAVDALVARMAGRRATGLAGELAGSTLLDLGRELLVAQGERPARSRHDLARQLVSRSGGTHSTSDFPTLLASTGQRRLLEVYMATQSPLKMIARRQDASDFRTLTMARLGGAPELLDISEGGEVKYGTRAESKETFKLKTAGRNFALTREALINDDLGAFADSAAAFAVAASNYESDRLAALLLANTGNGINLDDGNPIFTTARGNKAGAGSAVTEVALTAGRKALRETKDLDGKTLVNTPPRYLLVGAAKETEAEKALAQIQPTTAADVNPFGGKLELLVEPRLAGNSWRLFADPAFAPVLAYAYLNGNEGPLVEDFSEADTLGIIFRVTLDFGCGAIGWRGSWLNPGD